MMAALRVESHGEVSVGTCTWRPAVEVQCPGCDKCWLLEEEPTPGAELACPYCEQVSSVPAKCETCHGTGWQDPNRPCEKCDGWGWRTEAIVVAS